MFAKKHFSLILGILLSSSSIYHSTNAQTIDLGLAIPTVQKVNFKNHDINMVGNLYFPPNFDKDRKYSAIVVSHPWGGVKEQTSGLYAKKLAERGFITLAFDASHYGESGGEPKYLENPFERVEDIRSAVDYLSTLSAVNSNQIGALGICAGGGYTISAAQTDTRIKAIAGISTFDVGAFSREGFGSILTISAEERKKIMDEVGVQRTKEARGEPARIERLIASSRPDKDIANFFRESFDYYATPRGQHQNSTGNFRYISISNQMAFYPFDHINTISPRPLLLIAGANAESLYFSKIAYEKAAQPKELVVIPNAYHFDLYDKPEYVDPSVLKMTEFFQTYLIDDSSQ